MRHIDRHVEVFRVQLHPSFEIGQRLLVFFKLEKIPANLVKKWVRQLEGIQIADFFGQRKFLVSYRAGVAQDVSFIVFNEFFYCLKFFVEKPSGAGIIHLCIGAIRKKMVLVVFFANGCKGIIV